MGLDDERNDRMAFQVRAKRGPITKIMQLDGGKGDSVSFAVGRWYGFPEFGCHMGEVDSSGYPENLGSGGQAAIRAWWPTITFTPLQKCTPWADTIVPVAESALHKEGTS